MNLPVFSIACWVLGLMAFAQLLVAGMALAMRFEQSRQLQVVEKIVFQSVTAPPSVAPTSPVVPALPTLVSRPPAPPPEPTPMSVPQI
ncbi:MAG: hypothetical protein WCS43_14740, partial [Verrucomicrobiota bacterium]